MKFSKNSAVDRVFWHCDIRVYSHKSYFISSDGNKPEADITSKTRTIKIIDHDDKSHKLKLRDESNADAEEIIVDSDDDILFGIIRIMSIDILKNQKQISERGIILKTSLINYHLATGKEE